MMPIINMHRAYRQGSTCQLYAPRTHCGPARKRLPGGSGKHRDLIGPTPWNSIKWSTSSIWRRRLISPLQRD